MAVESSAHLVRVRVRRNLLIPVDTSVHLVRVRIRRNLLMTMSAVSFPNEKY